MNYKVEILQLLFKQRNINKGLHVINEVYQIMEVCHITLKVNKADELNIKQQDFISGVSDYLLFFQKVSMSLNQIFSI